MVGMIRHWRRQARELRRTGHESTAAAFDACADELERRVTSYEDIKRRAAAEHGVSVGDLSSTSRRRQVVRARNAAMLHCREIIGATLEEIGREFNRSHATVLHGLRAEGK